VEIIVNGQPYELTEPTTVAGLLAKLGLTQKHVAVEKNLELVPRQRHVQEPVAAGDRFEIVTLVGGG
jgi:thiamine biosynthesis protein ThiS